MAKEKRTKKKTSEKSSTKSKKTTYKRGSLGQAIYEYFDKVGVDEAKYDDTLKVAQKVMPTTKFNKSHYSWYKNKYRELGGKKRPKK